MKKLKILAIITIIILVIFIAAAAALAYFGVFSFNLEDTPGIGNIILSPEETKNPYEVPDDYEITAKIKTSAGEMVISLSDTSAAEKFISLSESGFFVGKEFSVLAENMFIQVKTEGEPFPSDKTDFSPIYGTVGFAMESDLASPSFFIITNSSLSGISKAFIESGDFDAEKASLYLEKGGMPEYEGKVIIFGKVISGMETAEKIASGENSGYTGGYSAKEPVIIESIEITHTAPEQE